MASERISAALRHRVRERANGLCEYCKAPIHLSTAAFHCDPVLPRKAAGKTDFSNLAWACPWCNTHKHTKTHAQDPQTGQQVPLFNPRRQKWQQHFVWSDDLLSIVGRTQTGRATVEALNMNRPEHVNRRKILQIAGEHPPPV